MTNYNERLDEVIDFIENYGVSASTDGFDKTASRAKAKQALTSLIKELVAEAKPEIKVFDDGINDATYFQEKKVNEYHTNLLKALEEL